MLLHHVAVVCGSQKNADRFYGEVLGLKKIKQKRLDGAFMDQLFGVAVSSELILYGNEQVAVEVFVPATVMGPAPALAHCCLAVKDRAAFLLRCQASGVPVKQVPRGDSPVVFIQDPDGNLFEIKEIPADTP